LLTYRQNKDKLEQLTNKPKESLQTAMDENTIINIDIESRRNFLVNFEWMISVVERYSNPLEFGLVLIEYGEKHTLGETYGATKAIEQLVSVTDSLKKAFRKTDIIGRYGSNFWIIVPKASENEKIQNKILDILQEAKHQGLNVVDRDISIFSLPSATVNIKKQFDSAEKFLDYLIEHKKELATHVFSLSATN
jgi:GGDEF domain-containing protein